MTRVLVAGLGDSGLLTAIHLARTRGVELVGVSAKPGLLSGQELGMRLARPEQWQRDYRVPFSAYRRLAGVRTVHGRLTALDLAARTVTVEPATGPRGWSVPEPVREPWDVLVIATGVSNGFWRRPDVQTDAEIDADLAGAHARLAAAGSVLVVGGGAAAVSSALQLAVRWPDKAVTLAYPGERALAQHAPGTWRHARRRLLAAGVELRGGHRAELPAGFTGEEITDAAVAWSTGQPVTRCDAVLWAVGRVRPNTGWLPAELLDEDGFVRVTPTLEVPGHPGVFAVGDVAATDPLRSSARNRADRLLAANVRAHLAGGPLASYVAPRRRWGSVLGVEPDGLRVFTPGGRPFRFPAWSVRTVLQPLVVRRGIYGGLRARR